MSFDLEKRLEVEKELQIAVKDLNQFELFYQPQYNFEGMCVGAEALIRWSHPDQTLALPGLFIPVAEETGLMLKLGRWVLIQSCLHLRILTETGIPKSFKKLSVNVSAIQFNQKSFVQDLLDIVRKTDINPNLLTIELTESTLIENVNNTVTKMTELRRHGIDISIDDFGTGYSSLAYLNQYPITTLKIDQTFVKDLHLDTGNRAIVNAMIGLGENLNIAVVAEGVETSEELTCLKDMKCFCYQGYYFCRPKPFPELVTMLRNNTRPQTSDARY
jgi:EAL domain-containing protein (putative c-di-GMP-specific phosphodiesterase class I)